MLLCCVTFVDTTTPSTGSTDTTVSRTYNDWCGRLDAVNNGSMLIADGLRGQLVNVLFEDQTDDLPLVYSNLM